MAGEISTTKQYELGNLGFAGVPKMVSAAGKKASFRFIEFFTANIRNPNTRVSYGRAVREFCQWCEDRGLQLEDLNPVLVAAYVELLGKPRPDEPLVREAPGIIALLGYFLVLPPLVGKTLMKKLKRT